MSKILGLLAGVLIFSGCIASEDNSQELEALEARLDLLETNPESNAYLSEQLDSLKEAGATFKTIEFDFSDCTLTKNNITPGDVYTCDIIPIGTKYVSCNTSSPSEGILGRQNDGRSYFDFYPAGNDFNYLDGIFTIYGAHLDRETLFVSEIPEYTWTCIYF